MRIFMVSRKDWLNYLTNKPKLEEYEFTTFRVPRKDKDWEKGERVQIVYQPRSPKSELLGVARIRHKEPKFFFYMPNGLFEERIITDSDAKRDGFHNSHEMYLAFAKMHGEEKASGQLNKLTLHWLSREGKVQRTRKRGA